MEKYSSADPWKIIEESYHPQQHPITESIMSLGNGRMGQRANFPETYAGHSLLGNYIAGVYYPDKTRVGWWKNGYPEYFAKVLNAVHWIKLKVFIDGEEIDLSKAKISAYQRTLDMQHGILSRSATIKTSNGKIIELNSERFYSLVDLDCCYMRYKIRAATGPVHFSITSHLDFNIRNSDANYDEDFWTERTQDFENSLGWVKAQTKKTNFHVCAAAKHFFEIDKTIVGATGHEVKNGEVWEVFEGNLENNQEATLTKCTAITSSFYYDSQDVLATTINKIKSHQIDDYPNIKNQHSKAWLKRWNQCDIAIDGDPQAQQGIRFNIFHLYQTYSGEDERLNIGPKGFTGEKYGGSTYWDTEAYCLPFYLGTADAAVARQLLVYRYNHLPKAIENASKLGFSNGAALYPMVTMNGEECHNEWEITFEEIHRNGAIAFGIFNYVRYTGDLGYLKEHGLEVLIGIARFWSQRVHISPLRNQYVMMGVTGPNEYENNVDNNWYTNYIARWCLEYTFSNIDNLQKEDGALWTKLKTKVDLRDSEKERWQEIINNLYLPTDANTGLFIQHDGYLNKENITVSDLDPAQRPINQKWSWDRILRSPFIKQADVLQGMYFFEDHFTRSELELNFEYYEPRTVHESSLSPCVHSILAASLGKKDKAYEMYLRTARLDLDNYNNDTEDGCHITSMAGTWMSIVEGFAGRRIVNDLLTFNPFLPKQWKKYSFKVNHRGCLIELVVAEKEITAINHSDSEKDICIESTKYRLSPGATIKHPNLP